MKASLYARMQYVTPQNLPGGWPVAPALYDPKIGMQCFQDGMEKLEFADYLGFDWISFSEHHYSYNSVAPHPAIMAAAMGRTYRERMPNCHYVLVYDAGHAVADERPEALTNTLTDFLDLRETFIVSRRNGRINP